jgi:hypothetical protein
VLFKKFKFNNGVAYIAKESYTITAIENFRHVHFNAFVDMVDLSRSSYLFGWAVLTLPIITSVSTSTSPLPHLG